MEQGDSFTFVVSTAQVDRAGDQIDQNGWDLEGYTRNPVVLLSHAWQLPPIGKAIRTWVESDRLMATIRFADTPLGLEISRLQADDYMRAVSAGFRPIKWELRRDARGLPLGMHFHQQELLEISVVSIPANPETLRKALADNQLCYFSQPVSRGWDQADKHAEFFQTLKIAITKETR